MSVDIDSITTGEIIGEGIFDSLMRAVKAHLQEEFDAGRITGAEYAQVYLGSLQAVVQYSIQFGLQQETSNNQAALLAQRLVTERAQTEDAPDGNTIAGVLGKQKELYQAQIDGFAQDARQKYANSVIDTWVVRQTTDGEDAPSAGLDNPSIKDAINAVRVGVDLPELT